MKNILHNVAYAPSHNLIAPVEAIKYLKQATDNWTNILNRNYLNVYVSCSQDLFKEGFINYFEQQLFLWIKTTPTN